MQRQNFLLKPGWGAGNPPKISTWFASFYREIRLDLTSNNVLSQSDFFWFEMMITCHPRLYLSVETSYYSSTISGFEAGGDYLRELWRNLELSRGDKKSISMRNTHRCGKMCWHLCLLWCLQMIWYENKLDRRNPRSQLVFYLPLKKEKSLDCQLIVENIYRRPGIIEEIHSLWNWFSCVNGKSCVGVDQGGRREREKGERGKVTEGLSSIARTRRRERDREREGEKKREL